MELAIKNAKIIQEGRSFTGTILIDKGKIAKISCEDHGFNGIQTIDATGKVLMPGVIDVHSHICEPSDNEYREDFRTGSRAAARGGITSMLEMPLSIPPVSNRTNFEYKLQRAKRSVIDFAFWGAFIPEAFEHFEELKALGCIGFKAFLPFAGKDYPRVDDYQLLTGMEQLSALGSLLGVHAENDDIINGKEREFIKAGNYSGRYHEQSRPEISEIESIQKAILFAEETKCSMHICHLSTARAKEIILTAKAKGLSLTVETCPHYLCLTVSDLERLGGYAKCNPPLRTEDNRNKLWDMIKDGTIDCIASDHSPYTNEDRDVHEGNIWEMPPGIGGLELFLPLLIDEGYHKRGVPLEQIAQLTSHTPARRFGIANQKGAIEIGRDADLVIVDTEREWTFSANDSFMKAKCTKGPYEGRKIKGCVETTIVRGTIVYDGQTIQAPEGYGKMITARKGGHHD